MTQFTKYMARKCNKKLGNPLKLPQVFLWTQQKYCFLCVDLHQYAGDAVLMTSNKSGPTEGVLRNQQRQKS